MRKLIIPLMLILVMLAADSAYAVTEFVSLIRNGQPNNISSVSRATNVVTVTLSLAYPNNNLKPGQPIIISGVTDTSFNGKFTIVSAAADQLSFTYNQTASNATSSGGTASGDYSLLSTWVAAIFYTATTPVGCTLTTSATKVFSHDPITGTIADDVSVTLYRGGTAQDLTATVCHATPTQILVKGITGSAVPAANDQWRVDGSNYLTILDAGDSAIVVAECYNDWLSGLNDSGLSSTTIGTINDTTDATRYVKIYVPLSERHTGVGKDAAGNYTGFTLYPSASNKTILTIYCGYTRCIGIAVDLKGYAAGTAFTGTPNRAAYTCFEACLAFNGTGTTTAFYFNSVLVYLINCIAYNTPSGFYFYNTTTATVYNCTAVNCSSYGFHSNVSSARTTVAKNCLAYNNGQDFSQGTTYSPEGTFSVEYSVSKDASVTTVCPAGAGNRPNQTVTFFDSVNNNFCLAYNDTAARRWGEDLSADAVYPFSNDFEGNARVAPLWDIGADQSPAVFYRSVGPGNTTALVSNVSPASNALTITNTSNDSTATFLSALPLNVGVGDVIQYAQAGGSTPDNLVFITGRNSSTSYTVRTAGGSLPTAVTVGNTNWAIYRAYTSLANAENGIENTGIYSGLRNFDDWTSGGTAADSDAGKDLVTANQQWNIACYADAADTTALTIDGWTTAERCYLRVYAPFSATDTGITQRHSGGLWNTNAYRLEIPAPAASTGSFNICDNYVRIEGLQIQQDNSANNYSYPSTLLISGLTTGKNYIYVSNCIIRNANSANSGHGIKADDTYARTKIYNNIIYGYNCSGDSSDTIITGSQTSYIYNNTIVDGRRGINGGTATIAKNNIFQGCTYPASGTFAAGTDYNATNSAAIGYSVTGSGNTHDRVNQIFGFVDAANKDYHLLSTDVGATGVGVNLSSDTFIPFSSDIDSGLRWAPWSIGADQPAVGVAASVADGVPASWNAPATWASGVVPSATQDVVITANKIITFDKNDSGASPTCGTLTINGTLVIDTTTAANRTMVVNGDIIVKNGGVLTIRSNSSTSYSTTIKFNCATNAQYGLIVESGGTLDIQGTSKYDPDVVITALTQDGSHNAYIYCMDGSKSKIKFADISYMGASAWLKAGIYVYQITNGSSEYFYMEGSKIHHGYYGIQTNAGGNHVIFDNTIYSNSAGIKLSMYSANNLVASNVIYSNSGDGVTSTGNYDVLTRNIIRGNANGISLLGDGVIVCNNTLDSNTTNGIYVSASSADNAVIRNNIITTNTTGLTNSGTGTTIDRNFFYGNTANGSTGTNAITASNPNYISTDSSNVNFMSVDVGSAALGAGCRLDTGAAETHTNVGARTEYVYNITDNLKFNSLQAANDAAACTAGDTITVYSVSMDGRIE